MRPIYLDMEFNQRCLSIGNGHTIFEMISIGLVNENDQTYYAVSNEFNLKRAKENPFLKKVVLPRLNMPQSQWKPRAQIKDEVLEFLGGHEEDKSKMHYWFIPHDFMLFADLVSDRDFMRIPPSIDRIGVNLAQSWQEAGSPDILPAVNEAQEHNSLYDAKWLKQVHHALNAK